MEGVAKAEFVATVNELDLVSRWMTPFLRVSEIPAPRKTVAIFLAPFLRSGKPVTLQLMGDDAKILAETAKTAVALGAEGINLNCGCPSKRVVRHHSGGAMLNDATLIGEICRAIKDAIGEKEFSLKFRSGSGDWREVENFLPPLAASGDVDGFFYHCRTVAEGYTAIADRKERFLTAAQAAGDVPLVLNGDFDDGAESFAILAECRAKGAMIARNWMRDPYLLRRCEKQDAPDAETGRQLFFTTFCAKNPPRGAQLEICRMLWGEKSPVFRKLCKKTK